MSDPQRREFLAGAAALAAATATLSGTGPAEAAQPEPGDEAPEPVRGNQGAPILESDPRNSVSQAYLALVDRIAPATASADSLRSPANGGLFRRSR